MPAFEIHKRKRQDVLARYEPCVNGCETVTGSGKNRRPTGRRNSSHVCLILGHPTYLCPKCQVAWSKAWAEALEGSTGIEFEEAA